MGIRAASGTYLSVIDGDICIGSVQVSTPGLIAGRWYDNGMGLAIDKLSTDKRGDDTLYAVPFPLEQRALFDRIAIETTGSVSSNKNIRLGIYENDNGLPGDLILDAGEIDLDSASLNEAAITASMDVGWVWLAFVHNGGNSVTFRSFGAAEGSPGLGYENGDDTDKTFFVKRDFSYDSIGPSLPSPFGESSFVIDKPPRLLLRVSSVIIE